MAQAQTQFLYVGPLSPREVMPKAEAAARKAVQIDEQLALGHRTLGMILHDFYWHWKEADEELRRARELTKSTEAEPIGAQALSRAHRFDEAIAQAERNLARDPLSFNAYINVATVYRATHQYDRAIAEFRRALELSPDQPRGHFQIAVTLLEMGHLNDAIGELETAVASSKGNPRFHAYLGYAYAKAGRRGDARSILKHLEARRHQQYVSSFGIALIYDALGEKDAALAAFERAYDDRAVEFSQMTQWPPFETIASDPRFKGPMRAIELRP
jgi:tetratricopeptide (TPR) repeat protein